MGVEGEAAAPRPGRERVTVGPREPARTAHAAWAPRVFPLDLVRAELGRGRLCLSQGQLRGL